MFLQLCFRGVSLRGNCTMAASRTSTAALLATFRGEMRRVIKCLRSSDACKNFRVLRSLRLAGPFSGISLTLIRQAHCKSLSGDVGGRANPLAFRPSEYRLTWVDFWALIRPYLRWLLAAALGALAVALLNIRIPLLLGRMVDIMGEFLVTRLGPHDFGRLRPIAVELLALYIGQAALTFLYIACLSAMGERIAADLRVRLFGHLLHFDMAFYDQRMTGELGDRLNFDVQEFKSAFKSCVSQGLRTITQTAGCMATLYMLSPTMTVVTAGILPLVVTAGSVFGAVLRRVSAAAQQQSSFAMGIAGEALSNIRTVKEFAMEETECSLYRQEVEKARLLNERLGIGIATFQAASNLFLNGVVLGILYGGSHLIASSDITAGGLMSFLVTSQLIQRSLSQLSLVFGNAVRGYTACARIHEFLNQHPSQIAGDVTFSANALSGDLRFENVSFAYPTRPDHPVITQLTLDIAAGQQVALCGQSGSGKSTVAALIERLYEPQAGRILLDGVDLRSVDPHWLRRSTIGVISQEPVLFATTVEENIRYGRVGATDEEVREAARLANADMFIRQFPNGYRTMVGERGVALSGGQKQRIAIARALLKDPPILILDEATSALDAESERVVQEALDRVARNRTVIIIAHRLSTIRNADLIYVVGNGKVLEHGSHQQLLRKKGAYHTLIQLQHGDGII